VRLISFIDGERGYCTLIDGPEGTSALRVGADEPVRASSAEPAEEGRARLEADGGAVEVSWSPAGPALEFVVAGRAVTVYGVAASGSGPDGSLSGPGVAFELPDRDFSTARTVWAITAKSRLLVLFSLRPEDSRDHGEELLGAATIEPREEPSAYAEPLLSTQYDEAGVHVRATLELWREGESVAERGAGRRIAGAAAATPYGRLEAARFAWGLGGTAAVGGYDILTP